MIRIDDFQKKLEFDWEVLDVIISGSSAIDTKSHLKIHSLEEAKRFLLCYGYDTDNPIENAELFGNFQESINFIRKFFLQPQNPDGLKTDIPRKISEITDICQLLIIAGENSDVAPSTNFSNPSLWACAILKVMHTIAHIDKDLRVNYFPDIQKQILDRIYKYIHRDEMGSIFLGKDGKDEDKVELVSFEAKPKKARESTVLKLLHKPENVAEDIFDRVGIRFVTKNTYDSIRVVKFLKDRYVLCSANIKPSRSRNTLFNVEEFKRNLGSILDLAAKQDLSPPQAYDKMVELTEKNRVGLQNADKANPHSSEEYRSIQFTARQLVKIKNSFYEDLRAIRSSLKNEQASGKTQEMFDKLDLRNIQKEVRFFYPFEVQVCDEISNFENIAGRSSHANYKKSQLQMALRRVMGPLALS